MKCEAGDTVQLANGRSGVASVVKSNADGEVLSVVIDTDLRPTSGDQIVKVLSQAQPVKNKRDTAKALESAKSAKASK